MERKFVILTDTGSDLPKSYYEAHGLEEIPLGFTMDGVTYGGDDGQMPPAKEFYARLRGGSMPKTFQATPDQAFKHFEAHAKRGEDMLVLAFSSGLSGTYNSYMVAARDVMEQYPACRIEVVDTRCASMGQGLLVDYAVGYADGGATLHETAEYLRSLVPHICHFFTVEDLFHLHRGGRVSAATAVMGSMLKIKPVLHVDDEGHLIAIGKAMGRRKSISALAEKFRECADLGPDDPVFFSHGDCEEDLQYLLGILKEDLSGRRVVTEYIGPVIGTHSGAGTLAIFFKGKHR